MSVTRRDFVWNVQSDSGETLVETLVAILISTLAMIMLSSAIGTARNIVFSSREAIDDYYTADTALASGVRSSNGVGWNGSTKIGINIGGNELDSQVTNVAYVSERLPGNATGISYRAR